eukprot:UN26182
MFLLNTLIESFNLFILVILINIFKSLFSGKNLIHFANFGRTKFRRNDS